MVQKHRTEQKVDFHGFLMLATRSRQTHLRASLRVMAPTRLTVVLVGQTGNGKSATGNSLLGREAFVARRSLQSVTERCRVRYAALDADDEPIVPGDPAVGVDEGSELFAEFADSCLAGKGLAHAEAGNDDIGLVGSQGSGFGGEVGGAIASGQHVAGPTEVADGDGVLSGLLQKHGFKVAMDAQLVGEGVADYGDTFAGTDCLPRRKQTYAKEKKAERFHSRSFAKGLEN